MNKKRGFSLIEMVVALFILSITVTFATVVIGTIKIMRDSAYESSAFRIASSKLDELRAGGYDALPPNGVFTDPELANLPQGFASTSVSDLNAKTKQAAAGVSWLGADGVTRYVTLTTLITQIGGL